MKNIDISVVFDTYNKVKMLRGALISLNYGQAGLLFDPGNQYDLFAKLFSFFDDQGFARSLAQAGMHKCRRKYSKTDLIAQLGKLYDRLLKNDGLVERGKI